MNSTKGFIFIRGNEFRKDYIIFMHGETKCNLKYNWKYLGAIVADNELSKILKVESEQENQNP